MRYPHLSWLVWTAAALFSGPAITAQTTESRSAVAREVDDLFSPLVDRGMVSASVLISRGDEIILARGYGHANREHVVGNRPQTVFRIASISKSVTAIAILQLVDSQLIDLDTRLERLVPGFPNGEKITIEHLLSHTSGIPSDVYLEDFQDKSVRGLSLEESVEWLRGQAPQFSPGDRFSYSNSGYLLLSAVIEKATGMKYEEYLRKEVFAPAAMTDSGLDSATRIVPHRASGYSRSGDGEIIRAAYRDPSFGYGYGALYSTVLDLHRLARAVAGNKLMSRRAREEMLLARHETPWSNRYGLGWFLDQWDGQEYVAALGSTAGFMGTLRHFTAADVVLVVLLNQDFMLYEELFDQLSSIALGRSWQPLFSPRGESTTDLLADCLGVYEMEDGVELSFELGEHGLVLTQEGIEKQFEVVPLSRRKAYVPEQNGLFRFSSASDGSSRDGDMELLAIYGNLAWRGRRIVTDGE
ncbi:MAG: beta-lactamase family protein [Holophagales bacterium]|nr:beta-lactamase family protein [Holophagales bacterium]